MDRIQESQNRKLEKQSLTAKIRKKIAHFMCAWGISSAIKSFIFGKNWILWNSSENTDIGYKDMVKKKNKSQQFKNNIYLTLISSFKEK